MYEGNADIDHPDNEWTDEAIERLFLFCQFARAMPYEKFVAAYRYFLEKGYYSFKLMRTMSHFDMIKLCKEAGLRFPTQTAKFLYHNIHEFDGASLKKMSRDDLAKHCVGFGMKLASMFHNRIHGTQYAIIDVHINRYLREHGCTANSYHEKERCFIELAKQQGKTPDELDWEIWDTMRIGRKKISGVLSA
jgi:thermostable 8-oxoguanine DNA glycosylase